MTMPRAEYPRPQFVRESWLCLNGEWEFEIDPSDSGRDRGLLERPLTGTITVPFCPESSLSGVGNRDYLNAVWYRRRVTVPSDWSCERVLVHFQAVDYDATFWVDGVEAYRHRGGFMPVSFEITIAAGESFELLLRARDTHTAPQSRGKQAMDYAGSGAIYCRTTGIWQTVWMEPVHATRLERTRITPDVEGSRFLLEQPLVHGRRGLTLTVELTYGGKRLVKTRATTGMNFSPLIILDIPAGDSHLWAPGDPHLYDIELTLADGHRVLDHVRTYAGLRSVAIDGKAITINGETVFQRLVLDQGYYPDGILTAPTDEALKADITLSMAAGFNGARLHQKVFEERFLYHADTLGYLVWGEFPDWGCGGFGPSSGEHQKPGPDYITQWLEVLQRDFSHPSIIGWCPLNETWQAITDNITQLDDVTRGMFLAAKAMDVTRPGARPVEYSIPYGGGY